MRCPQDKQAVVSLRPRGSLHRPSALNGAVIKTHRAINSEYWRGGAGIAPAEKILTPAVIIALGFLVLIHHLSHVVEQAVEVADVAPLQERVQILSGKLSRQEVLSISIQLLTVLSELH